MAWDAVDFDRMEAIAPGREHTAMLRILLGDSKPQHVAVEPLVLRTQRIAYLRSHHEAMTDMIHWPPLNCRQSGLLACLLLSIAIAGCSAPGKVERVVVGGDKDHRLDERQRLDEQRLWWRLF